MTTTTNSKQTYSSKLIGLDTYFNEMLDLYDNKKLPKVLLLNGKKGIGKFTLAMHFINYIYSKNETNKYDVKNKVINTNSSFYNSLLNQTSQDIIFVQAEENKNIKIDEIRSLKSILANSSLSNNFRFTIIDEVEFLNTNSVNALLKILEEPSDNYFFILINNQQVNLVETIASRCLKSNIFLDASKKSEVINYLIEDRSLQNLFDFNENLSPGQFLKFNEIYFKYKIHQNDNIFIILNTLVNGYKKEKDKSLINLVYFLIDDFFFHKIKDNVNKIEFLLHSKSSLIKIINNFVLFNLNINLVLNSIKINLKDV